MKKINLLIFILVIIIAVLGLTIFMQKTTQPPVPVQQELAVVEQPEPVKKPIVHYPVPTPPPVTEVPDEETQEQSAAPEVKEPELPKTLPPIEQSDQTIEEALQNLKLGDSLSRIILLENFIQRLVTTIDNLPEKKLPRAHLPIVPPKPPFIVAGTEDSPQTSRRNFARYANHVKLLETLDSSLALKLYIHFYPLFQTAYEQLGYNNAYFNDRLVYVIGHLLETPEPNEPIALTQPVIVYKYADPLLEQLSTGQKMLLRIGPENRSKAKKILASYRDKLINLHP
ncbi:Protein of unknown function [Malonomonas rubra DSM 5091]|uniref:DUF3014 domain-containing protein n=1 Tax=Malonomonas rubra DSM 5091 TaxID=1122189 RepID=A0A1M6BAW7_MALRU|nr:DUF3014 domain-containing protein [Malonomonas rubra]SHI45855.1 Protein of unknown function [Malonomonas rubra DSM 5091]